jgi:Replication-relaxation
MNARYVHATYTNTAVAERALHEHGREVRQKANSSNSFFHDLMASVLGAAFELSARADPEITYLSWEEIRDHHRTLEKTRHSPAPFNIPLRHGDLRPDGRPFGYQFTRPDGRKRTLLFAGTEADRSTEPLKPSQLRHSSLTQKFEDYREIYRSHFGFPIVPLVPIITVSEARMRNIITLLAEAYRGKKSKFFLFRAIPTFASFEHSIPIIDDLLTCPWRRVGAGPVRLIDILKPS